LRRSGRLLLVLAHPDDETFFAAGTVARHVAEGGEALLACATRGERGSQPATPVCLQSELGRVRSAELEAACRVMGADGPVFLGYPDGGLASADPAEASAKIADLLAGYHPDAVVTFAADGVYGHPDHVAIHCLTRAAFDRVHQGREGARAGPESAPEGTRLWYVSTSSAVWRYRPHEWTAATREAPPPGKGGSSTAPRGRLPVYPGLPEAAIDINDTLETKMEALLCHRSQRHNVHRAFGSLYDFESRRPTSPESAALLRRECFTLGRGPRPRFVLEDSLLDPGT
jgi:LmbE family N-acetylglucosaminyl deacetylase